MALVSVSRNANPEPPRHPYGRREDAGQRRFAAVAAGSGLVAAAIHAAVVPEHLAEAPPAGWFFITLAVVQTALAVALLRPLPVVVLLAAIVGHLGVVALYVASRTVDLPFLPTHGEEHLPVAGGVGDGIPVYPGAHLEPVGGLDAACLGVELVMLCMLTALLPERLRSRVTTAMTGLAVTGLLARLVGVGG